MKTISRFSEISKITPHHNEIWGVFRKSAVEEKKEILSLMIKVMNSYSADLKTNDNKIIWMKNSSKSKKRKSYRIKMSLFISFIMACFSFIICGLLWTIIGGELVEKYSILLTFPSILILIFLPSVVTWHVINTYTSY